jgi:hypothetical protein
MDDNLNLNDLFGDNPRRPNHKDFWALSSTVLRLDGAMQEANGDKDEELLRLTGGTIDLASAQYMGEQRALRAAAHLGIPINEATMPLFTTMTALYLEALIVGRQSLEV